MIITLFGPDGRKTVQLDVSAAEALPILPILQSWSVNGVRHVSQHSHRNAKPVQVEQPQAIIPKSPEETVFSVIQPNTRAFLKAILQAGDWVSTRTLAERLGVSSTALGGFSGDLSKKAQDAGLVWGDFIEKKTSGSGPKRENWYKPGRALRDNASLLA